MSECIVKGCLNRKAHGYFVGELCVPCHRTLTTGDIRFGKTFIHDLQAEVKQLTFESKEYRKHSWEYMIERDALEAKVAQYEILWEHLKEHNTILEDYLNA